MRISRHFALGIAVMAALALTIAMGRVVVAGDSGPVGATALLGASPRTLDRNLEPVLLRGEALVAFTGVPVDELFVYRYLDATWGQVPAQVDEVTEAGKYTGLEDGLLDDNDELVFMAADLGDRAPAGALLTSTMPVSGTWYEIEVTDPVSPANKGWAYLLHSTTMTASFTADYVDFDPDLHRIAAASYSVGLSHEFRGWDHLAFSSNNVDILDRTKIRIFCAVPGICPTTEDDIAPKPDGLVKDGPVRVIVQDGIGLAYGSLLMWRPTLIVPPSRAGDVALTTDFNSGVTGATFYNAAVPDGVVVDGIPDVVPLQPYSKWWQVSSDAGTVVQTIFAGIIGGTPTNFYQDDMTPDPNDTGDGLHFGDTGILAVEPRNAFKYHQAFYFLPGAQPNLGDAYWDYFKRRLSAEVTLLVGIIPDDVIVGDPSASVQNFEFSPDMSYASWIEVREPPVLRSLAWFCEVDPDTGELIPSDGRGALIGEIKNKAFLVGAPHWGEDATGPFVVTINLDDQLVLARPGPTATLTVLPTPPNPTRVFPFSAKLPDREHSYVAYVQADGEGEAQAFYIDLAEPTVEHQITFGPQGVYPPIGMPPLSIDYPRWFYGEPIVIFGYTNTVTSKLQIKQLDVSESDPQPVAITDDEYDHIDEFPAVLFGERYLVGGINNEAAGMLYQRPPGGEIYEPIQLIVPTPTNLLTPTTGVSFEPFTWEGRAYASFQIRQDSDTIFARNDAGEIWLTGLVDSGLLRKLNGPGDVVRVDPEFFVGTSKVWVFYVAKDKDDDSNGWNLHRAATGLVAGP